MKLADTAVGALRLQRLKTKMAAFVMEHPDEGIDLEMFYQAINPDIAQPQVAAEIATCIRNAIELYEALTVDVQDAPMPGEKRPAPPPPDLPRSPPARQAPHVADPLLAGGAAAQTTPARATLGSLGLPPPTFSFDDGSALGTVRTLAAAKLGDDLRSAFDDQTSPAAQVFSPLLAELNDALRASANTMTGVLRLLVNAGAADPLKMSLDDLEALEQPVERPSHVQVLQQAVFLREAYADVRDCMTHLCRLWWLSAHTRGCTFETARQVMFDPA